MRHELLFYTRRGCCVCEEMKHVVREVEKQYPLTLEEVEIDGSTELEKRYGAEVPVLFINGRKAFKFRVTARELKNRLARE